ncbi:MAG TPA: hypothetical protein VGZ48_04135 [Candidatus Acidoferrales bacterium]|nr:hypothetical protein [Candidatus Acidoferrales bacterium]
MPDWRHIQGRIRKARTSKDPATELAALYQTTNDAMVAFELAQFHEKAGSHADAAQWYQAAAQRFRRAQWKVKAEQALARLGVETPLAAAEAEAEAPMHRISDAKGFIGGETEAPDEFSEAAAAPDAGEPVGQDEIAMPESNESANLGAMTGDAAAGDLAKKKRRRGRRGGRGRRKKGDAAPASARAGAPKSEHASPLAAPPARQPVRRPSAPSEPPPEPRRRTAEPEAAPHVVGGVGPAAWQSRRHTAGEPALASRLAQLESKLRRLLSALPESLDDADSAPAGPGVFVVSDSDLHEVYYVEACQTLRIGVGNIVKTGRTREGENIRGRLAEHLGISESQVSKYLKEHCAVRWIQLDDEAPLVAHFAIAVLRPAVNG